MVTALNLSNQKFLKTSDILDSESTPVAVRKGSVARRDTKVSKVSKQQSDRLNRRVSTNSNLFMAGTLNEIYVKAPKPPVAKKKKVVSKSKHQESILSGKESRETKMVADLDG